MTTGKSHITGLCHTAVCIGLGAALVMLLGADARDVQVPPSLDSMAQRLRIQEELALLNGKMDELILLLRSGNVKVICLPADTDDGGPKHGRTADPIPAPSRGAAPASGFAR